MVGLAALLFLASDATSLDRVFAAGESDRFDVQSRLQVEWRHRGMETWLPSDEEARYGFTVQVIRLLPQGGARVRYKRPTLSVTKGEVADADPVTKIEKVNWDYEMDLSVANEILEHKDLAPKLPSKPKPPEGDGSLLPGWQEQEASPQAAAFVGRFVDDVFRLAAFTGSFDSALDLAPRLPFGPVKPGDSWKRTVGFQPQLLKGEGGKFAIQRLDYAYVYQGIVDWNGKKVHRVVARLQLNTDLAAFLNQAARATPEQTGLRRAPISMSAEIEFNLDLATRKTLGAVATAEGQVGFVAADSNEPIDEFKIKGRTVLSTK
ncbi:MAG: hypothetical protein HYR64_06060 [Fimbriimonas ginsengisoli]|uniref:Uncharacterized protein n=1 Tax=Fimbriimonas ginsengisoli TaxID=1005039 RepID=A0A931LXI5_FIMGI|nr:hypothetical protein [Fimbriimonas ginsengisoli]